MSEDTTAPTKPLRPRGKALKRTERMVERMSRVTAEDVEEARTLWNESASPQYRRLLDAK